MPRQSERKPRRQPQRRTSEQIVEAILDAAAELIGETGNLVAVTTNHVAERAGVSIGSLYRYFPDKESIVAALDSRHRRASAARFMASLADFERDFGGAVRNALRTFMEEGPEPAVRAALMRDVPAAWVASAAGDIWAQVVHLGASVLVRICPGLEEREARTRVFLAIHGAQGLSAGLLMWPLEGVTRDDVIELYACQVERMLLAPPVRSASSGAVES